MIFNINLTSLCVCVVVVASSNVLAAPTPIRPVNSPSNGHGLHSPPVPSRRQYANLNSLDFGSAVDQHGIINNLPWPLSLLQSARAFDSDSSHASESRNIDFGATDDFVGWTDVPSATGHGVLNVQGKRMTQGRVRGSGNFGTHYASPMRREQRAWGTDESIQDLGFGSDGVLHGGRAPRDWLDRLNFGSSIDFGDHGSLNRRAAPLQARHNVDGLHFGQTADFRKRWSWPWDESTTSSLRFGSGVDIGGLSGQPF